MAEDVAVTPLGRFFVFIGLVSPVLLPIFFLGQGTCCSQRASNERSASATLKTFATAQADFRENDRDGDGVNQFWRADVAGLYGLLPKGSDEMIKLIELSAAGADLLPAEGPPLRNRDAYSPGEAKAGYWFSALSFEDEAGGTLDPDRFVFCAVPDSLSAGKTVYAITQDGVLWQAPARAGRWVPASFPVYPATAGWTSSP